VICPKCHEELVLKNQRGELTCIKPACDQEDVHHSKALKKSEAEAGR